MGGVVTVSVIHARKEAASSGGSCPGAGSGAQMVQVVDRAGLAQDEQINFCRHIGVTLVLKMIYFFGYLLRPKCSLNS